MRIVSCQSCLLYTSAALQCSKFGGIFAPQHTRFFPGMRIEVKARLRGIRTYTRGRAESETLQRHCAAGTPVQKSGRIAGTFRHFIRNVQGQRNNQSCRHRIQRIHYGDNPPLMEFLSGNGPTFPEYRIEV